MKDKLAVKQTKKNITNGSSTKISEPLYSGIDLREALFHVEDMLGRAQVPFYVLGSTGRHLHKGDEELAGDEEVRVGVKKAELRREAMVTLKQFIPDLVTSEYQLSYFHNGVPVIIDVIHTDYSVLQHPDTRFFYTSEFKIPNPWDQYWQQREFIK